MLRIDALANQSKGKNVYPNLRIGANLALLVLSLSIENLWLYGALILSASFLILGLTRITFKQLALLVLFPMSFVFFSCVIIFFQIGLEETLITFVRSLSALMILLSISLTMPMHHFTQFLKKLHLPDAFIELYELCYRFIFIFIEEAADMITAQQMRFGFFSAKNVFQTLSLTLGTLFLRVFARFNDLEDAMSLRGFQ
ncbi:CbiQ family ECF transporter T component [Fusibacter sp. JL298sf-3]